MQGGGVFAAHAAADPPAAVAQDLARPVGCRDIKPDNPAREGVVRAPRGGRSRKAQGG